MPNPVLRIDLRNCFGMIASVSTFSRSIGATSPLWMVNFCMVGRRKGCWVDCCRGLLVLRGRAFDLVADLLDVLAEAVHGVACRECEAQGQEDCKVLHGSIPYANCRMSTKWPCTAAAAAMAGLTRCVRPPAPWRPSKLRLLVDAQRSPGSRRSAFMARHIEQPGSRHSKPAPLKTLSRPSRSACSFTRPEPGTTIASFTFAATRAP